MVFTRHPAALVALLAVLGAASHTQAACSHITRIQNDSGITLRFDKLKSSIQNPVYKTQWDGSLSVPAGSSGTIRWTSDWDCADVDGKAHRWDVKIYRNNGSVHFCGNLAAGQNVRVTTPDLCFPD